MKKTKEELEIDSTKRDFMKKFGSYAATAPIGMFLLMSPNASAAVCSGQHFGGSHARRERRLRRRIRRLKRRERRLKRRLRRV